MDLVIKLFVIICSIFIYISNVNSAETTHHCCENNEFILNTTHCKDKKPISIVCEDSSMILLNPRLSFQKFSIGIDSKQDKAFLDAYEVGYHVYQPHFCTGELYYYGNFSSSSVAVACISEKERYNDFNINGTDSVQMAKFYRVFSLLTTVFNLASGLLLLTTAAIYYSLPNLQNTQDTCYFFFSLVAGIGHSAIFYMDLFNAQGIFPDMCITNTYLLFYCILCGITWSTLTCYNIWRTSMNYTCDDEAKLLSRYKLFGFGFPFFLLFCAWAYAHINHIADLTINLECFEHFQNLYAMFGSIPILIMIFLNTLMFFHSQIRIWSLHTIQLRERKLAIKILKYRLFMNAKLFFIMGVPWALLMLCFVLEITTMLMDDWVMTVILYISALSVFGEGIPIFVILVLFRKRVLRGAGDNWFPNSNLYPDKWKTAPDSETENEVSDDEETPSKTPEAFFTAKTEEEHRNGFDDTTIVIL